MFSFLAGGNGHAYSELVEYEIRMVRMISIFLIYYIPTVYNIAYTTFR